MEQQTSTRGWRASLLVLALFSGGAALIYETVWLRWFRLLFGSTTHAASATLFAFFAGLAIGSALFGRLSSRTRRAPLLIYAWIELAAAGAAIVVPHVIGTYEVIYGQLYQGLMEHREIFIAVKFGLALIAMLPATILLGGTLPVLASAFVVDTRDLGRAGGLLYGVNTLGAAMGAALAALWLPERLGVNATYGVALGTSLAAGGGAWLLHRVWGHSRLTVAQPHTPISAEAAPRRLRVLAFASGFGTLAFEVMLIHALGLLSLHSVYSFGVVLILVLASLSLGAMVASLAVRRFSAESLITLAFGCTSFFLLTLPWLTAELKSAFHWTSVNPQVWDAFGRALPLATPTLLMGGLVLPLVFQMAAGGSVGRRVGGLVAANTVGGILGSLVASFVLLEHQGLWGSLGLLGVSYGLATLAVVKPPRARLVRAAVCAAVVAAIAVSPMNPWQVPAIRLRPGQKLIALRQGADGVIAVVQRERGSRQIFQNGIYSLGITVRASYAERAGHLPLLLHPDPRRALFVGTASGCTAGAAVVHDLEEISLVEIVPAVQSFAAEYFGSVNRNVYEDPRTRVVIEDGRNHVRGSPERYDVVVADLFVPWRAGVGSLYSLEHFQSVREHLTEDGVFSQWLPLFELGQPEFAIIARTFLEVFPNAAVWRSDFYAKHPKAALIGFAGSPPPTAVIDRRARELGERGIDDRWVVDPSRLWMLYVGPLEVARPLLAESPINTDDHPFFEFIAGRTSPASRVAFLNRGWPYFTQRIVTRTGEIDPLFPDGPGPGPLGGSALAQLVSDAAGGRTEEIRRSLSRARAVVPPDLLQLDWSVSDAKPPGKDRR